MMTAVLLATAALLSAALPLKLSASQHQQLDHAFVCPERLSDDAARFAAMQRFMTSYASFDPAATMNDRLAYRARLLDKHRCAPDGDTAHYTFPKT